MVEHDASEAGEAGTISPGRIAYRWYTTPATLKLQAEITLDRWHDQLVVQLIFCPAHMGHRQGHADL
jgi:hypothetical protein